MKKKGEKEIGTNVKPFAVDCAMETAGIEEDRNKVTCHRFQLTLRLWRFSNAGKKGTSTIEFWRVKFDIQKSLLQNPIDNMCDGKIFLILRYLEP
jgi:hypothetical protein